MNTFFVEKSVKNKIFKKVAKKGNKIIIYTNLERCKFDAKFKIAKKIDDILEDSNSKEIVIQKQLKKDEELIKLLYSRNINICDSTWLFKQCTNEIIKEICKNKKIEECKIWICVNEPDDMVEKYIYKFAKEFKELNIITNHIGKFKNIEKKLYEDEGIIVNISNNKRKSLLKADLILNIDFPKEFLNQFAIFDEATIINFEGDFKIRKKRFNGKVINDFKYIFDKPNDIEVFIKENELYEYDERDICQALKIVPKGEVTLKM